MTQALKWKVLLVTTAGTSLVFLDNTIMPIAIPTIAKEMQLSPVGGMWIVNSYLLALMALLFIGGKLVDLFGKRKLYLIGYSVFALSSLGGALSITEGMLIASRAIQGIGGALLLPATGALLLATFPLNQRARALGINTGISSLFLILGPVLGGFFTNYLSWRYIFLINLPVIFFGITMVYKLLPKEEGARGSFDVLGAFPLILSIISLVTALMQGSVWGWNSPALYMLYGACLVFFALFLLASRRNVEPVIDFSLFKNSLFYNSIFCIFITQLAVVVTVQWAVYFQEALLFTPFQTGLLILMAVSPVIVIAPLSGLIADILGARLPIILGFILLIFSFVWIHLYALPETTHLLYPGLIAFGCGIPLIYSPAFANAMIEVPAQHLGGASSVITMARQLAATLGIAVMTAIFQAVHFATSSYEKAFSAVLFLGISLSIIGLLYACFALKPKLKSV